MYFCGAKIIKNLICFIIFTIAYLTYSYSFACRPFVSTDASVAKEKKFELELGAFKLTHQYDENRIVMPSARINYGIIKNWELAGEPDRQIYIEWNERNLGIRDPAISSQGVIREGIL